MTNFEKASQEIFECWEAIIAEAQRLGVPHEEYEMRLAEAKQKFEEIMGGKNDL